MRARLRVGSRVRLRSTVPCFPGHLRHGVARIEHELRSPRGAVRLDLPLGGCRFWNKVDLVLADDRPQPMTDNEARELLEEIRTTCPRKRSGRNLYVITADETAVDVYRLTPSRKRATYETRVQLDALARLRLPLDVYTWAQQRTGRIFAMTKEPQKLLVEFKRSATVAQMKDAISIAIRAFADSGITRGATVVQTVDIDRVVLRAHRFSMHSDRAAHEAEDVLLTLPCVGRTTLYR